MKAKKGEDIEMPKFAAELEFHREEDAHPLFMQVLQSTTLPYIVRRRLLNRYKVWMASKGEEFWADQAIHHQVRMCTMLAVREILERSRPVTKKYISVNDATVVPLLSDNFEVRPNRIIFSSARTPLFNQGSGTSSPALSPPRRPVFNSDDDENEQEDGAVDEEDVTGTLEQLSSGDKDDESEVFGQPYSETVDMSWIKKRPEFAFRFPLTKDWSPTTRSSRRHL
ncbi:hypothetical protein BX616_002813 [Lobosporangium transversale]|nr:hypothetical protein BX616_002813 [Lobosporangium transversale]